MKAKYNFGARSSSGLAHFLWQRTRRRFAAAFAAQERERGDVPGWVMITLMSAVLVAGLLAIAAPALEGLFESALNQVRQP